MASTETPTPLAGPVLLAYDGCDLAGFAIEQAGLQLAPGREALVLCVWQTGDVGFLPVGGRHLKAAQATDVRAAAEETATHGASLAEKAGFRSQSLALQAAPTWKGIVEFAEQREVSLIVLGSHRHTGIARHLLGSVAGAVVAHSERSVLVVHRRS